jgi:hypothetical protein
MEVKAAPPQCRAGLEQHVEPLHGHKAAYPKQHLPFQGDRDLPPRFHAVAGRKQPPVYPAVDHVHLLRQDAKLNDLPF